MKKIDGRKLSTEMQQHNRYVAVELRKRGKTCAEVADILGIHLSSVSKWYRTYAAYGIEALVIEKRGVKLGARSKLSFNRLSMLKEVLVKYLPSDLNLGFSLWTRHAIQSLISKLWRIKVDLTTVGRYMKKLGFTPQKPVKRAYEQNPKAVKKWINETYPQIAEKAKKEGAEIHWLDETKLSSYSSYLRGFSPKGETPVIRMRAKRMSLNIISSVSKLGKMRFMIYDDSINFKTLTEFTNRLLKRVPKKLFVIMDNLPLHHSHKFKSWLKNHEAYIEVFYLPPYSPELNPDERLNRDLKTHFHSGSTVKSKKEFKSKVLSFMMKAQKTPKRVMNYFNSTHVEYAA
jgi:transposase